MQETKTGNRPTIADRFLRDARDHHIAVSLYLMSGFQLKGRIVDFDHEAVLFSHKDAHQLVMRSAIASMYPLTGSKREVRDWWLPYAPTVVPRSPPAPGAEPQGG